MSNYAARVPIPPKSAMNAGLSPTGSSLAKIFGRPGTLSRNCSPVTNEMLLPLLVTRDVGPFRVTGFRPAVESLERIFNKVHTKEPDLFKAIKTAGMTCCRAIRGSTRSYSIHSWGGAIDLFCGSDVVPLGLPLIHQGVLDLYPYFHDEGWYDGSEFTRNDSMHKEVAAQTVAKWQSQKWMSDYHHTAQKILDADKLVLNGYLIQAAILKDGHWWAPARDVARALDNELPADYTAMVKVREAVSTLNYKIVKTNDLRVSHDRFYITAYPSRGVQ
jgi:hypothetical protein